MIIGAPYQITRSMIKNLKISMVIEGSLTVSREHSALELSENPYLVPKQLGIYQVIDSGVQVTADQLANRIV